MAKFLIIRFSSIGDIVLTSALVRCLKTQVPDAEVHYLTKKAFQEIVSSNPYIDKIHVLDSSLKETIAKLKEEQFDFIIDLHHNLRTFVVKNKLRIMSFSFNKLNFKKWLAVSLKINKLPDIHIVDRYFKTVEIFDVQNDNKGLEYFIPTGQEIENSSFPEVFHKGYLAIVVGAKHNTKKIPLDKIIYLINSYNKPVILLGGKEDIETGEAIMQKVSAPAYNACGKYTLHQSASIVKQSKAVITADTGLMHIASAFKKTVFSIWGNTIPEFGMYPYLPGNGSEIFEVKGLTCRPCSKLGYTQCPKGHFNCMNLIDYDNLISNLRKQNID